MKDNFDGNSSSDPKKFPERLSENHRESLLAPRIAINNSDSKAFQ